jgi:hypothetical protein
MDFELRWVKGPTNIVQTGAAVFASVLGLGAVWIVSVELVRPPVPIFASNPKSIQTLIELRGPAGVAAWIGLIRGTLWTDYAMRLAPESSRPPSDYSFPTNLASLNDARTAAVRAVGLAPHDARAWIVIAGADARGLDQDVAGPLKMSYYTGANIVSLIPLRIAIATSTAAITQPELQFLAAAEIRIIITRKPELKPFIVAAYRNALPEGKRFIAREVTDLDPELLGTLPGPADFPP